MKKFRGKHLNVDAFYRSFERGVSRRPSKRHHAGRPQKQEMTLVQSARAMQWTNLSVVRFAAGEDDPVGLIQQKARELVLRARDAGWGGRPFNPLEIAKLQNIAAEANADVIDARTISDENGLRIQFNPTHPRERVRFSIAHEIAHTLFPDVRERLVTVEEPDRPDEWQLEMLCNLAAAEFVMPMEACRRGRTCRRSNN